MSELGQTSDPVDLIPGSVSGLDEFVSQWRERARTAGDIAAQLARLSSPEGWEGAAADGFAARLPDVGTKW
ncbi:putative T7SS-secreted protein [Microbacterium sp. BH-3-3-3]|uniref:putative T7SS-secreted protein n=1 Tax=Microbacterium sp. BH-3-3-3 TaxID=1906742 RepID=UPI0037C90571